jgi:hypothetical protein
VNKSQSQNECIGIVSGSLYTQENRQGIEECIGENNSKRGVKEDCQLRMWNIVMKVTKYAQAIYTTKGLFSSKSFDSKFFLQQQQQQEPLF